MFKIPVLNFQHHIVIHLADFHNELEGMVDKQILDELNRQVIHLADEYELNITRGV